MMMRRLIIISLIITCGFSASNAFAQKRGPSTPEERKRAVEIATLLENDPLNKEAKALSREFLIWLIEIPDITVTICTGMLGDYSKIKGEYAGTITTQLSFAETKFVIEHPDQAKDEYQVYLAGVESALKTYQNIKKVKPKVQLEPLEQLLVKQQAGELPDFIKTAMVACK
jgi:maltose-binding protein MalE